MSLKSKLKIENLGVFAALVFYAVAGIICFIVLSIANFPPHLGIIGVLSLLSAYGLFQKRFWTVWIVFMLFFIVTATAAVTLFSYFGKDLFLDISMLAYLILTWIFTAYVAIKREILKS